MAKILNTPNSLDQESSVVVINGEVTHTFNGTIPFGSSVRGYARKNGSSDDFQPVKDLDIREPGPVNFFLENCDFKWKIDEFKTDMAVTVEDGA